MKIALIGATGRSGSRILKEALDRGHQVTAIARHTETLLAHPRLLVRAADVRDKDAIAKLLVGHDAVISAVRFVDAGADVIVAAVKEAGVKRLLVVGGAGSLEMAPGKQVVDSPEFPAAHKPESLAGRAFLNALRSESALDWTFLSPAAAFAPGERTGKYRLGTDSLVVGADGQSRISMEDYAIAMIDELEQPRHSRRRFTVGQ
jgi:uncharacterized protein